jgi:hypothetical protein
MGPGSQRSCGSRPAAPHLPAKCRDREGKKAVARPPFSCPPLVTGCPLGVLQQIITRIRSSASKGNPFDCALAHAVRSERWALGSFAMLEAVTAIFGIMSVGIFIAHAVDGYMSGL